MWRMKVLVLFGVFVVGLSHAAVEGGPTTVPGGPTAGVGNNVTEPTHEYTTAGSGHGSTDGQVGSAATRASPSGKVEKWRTGAGNVPYSAPMQLGSKTKPLTTVSIAQNRTLPTPVTVTFGTETGSASASANLWGVIIFNGLKALLSYNTTAEQKPLLDLVSGVLKYDSSNYSKQYLQSLADILEDIFVPENGTREEKLGAIAENLRNSPYVGAIVSALKPMFSRLAASPQAQPLMNALMSGQIRPADWARLLGMLVQNFNTGGNVGIPSLPTYMGLPDISGILNLFKDWTGYHQLMKMVPLLLESPIQRFNVGAKCHQDLFTILGGLSDRESWALRMLDAFGKPSPDLMTYQLKWIGSFDECVALKGLPWASTSGVSRHFDAQYCSVGAPITAIKVPPEAEALVGGKHPVIQLGTCISDTCSDEDVTGIVKAVASLFTNENYTAGVECKREKSVGADAGAIAVVCVLSILGGLMVLGTLYDVIFVQMKLSLSRGPTHSYAPDSQFIDAYEMKQGAVNGGYVVSETGGEAQESTLVANGNTGPPYTKADTAAEVNHYNTAAPSASGYRATLGKLLLAFSVYTNGAKILNTRQAAGSLGAVNGIRFLSMAWVIFGHTYFFTGGYDDNLLQHVYTKMSDWTFMALPYATVAVDSFFTLSGLLVGYLTLRELKKVGGATKLNWFMYYFHRIWRLTPPYMLVIMVAIVIVPYLFIGPLWPMGDGQWVATCRKYWWTNLLYINNLVDVDKMCLGWSWYLSNDMQFYVISPLLLVPLFYHAAAGVLCCLIGMCSSIAITAYLVNKGQYSPQSINPYAYKPHDELFGERVYLPCYTRVSPYIIGMFTGYLLYRWKCTCKMPKAAVLAGWVVCLFITTSIVYGLYSDGDSHIVAPPAGTTYQVLFRPAWGAAVSWIVFACATGNGGWINQLLSWKAFVPLGRITYLAYLIHPLVMDVYYRSRRHYTHFTDYEVVYLFIGHLVLTYGVSFLLSLAFEAPWMALEKVLFKRDRRS